MKENKVKLSILIPSYNREKYISKAIDSVLNQEFQDFEIICSDNASTDNTYKILLEYAEKDDRIKVYQNETNLGPIANWENCLTKSNGEYIHWLWSDDWIESNFYIDAFNLMNKNNTNVVSTWNYRFDNDTEDKYISWQFSSALIPGEVAAKKILLMTYELPLSPAAYILPSKLVKKHFYKNIVSLNDTLNPVQKAVGVDSLMIIGTCLEEKKISILQKPSVVFRQHDNISSQLSKDGSLLKMYLLSHIWFISRNVITLSSMEYISLMSSIIKSFSKYLTNYKLLNILIKIINRIQVIGNVNLAADYQSRRVFIKRRIDFELSDNFKSFDLKNKKVYIAPLNDVTEKLKFALEKEYSLNITFIDNFKKGENIISSGEVKEYDYIFIYSPIYQKEIAKSLPKKSIYFVYRENNALYNAVPFSDINIMKQDLKTIFNINRNRFHKFKSYIKNIDMFSIGTQIVYLSNSFKKFPLKDKTIYITPFNDITEEIASEIKKYEPKEVILMDDEFEKLKEHDYLFVYDVKEKNRISKVLPKKNLYYMFHTPKKGITAVKYNYFNLLFEKLSSLSRLSYLNFIHRGRLILANSFNIPLHTNEKEILKLKNIHEGKRAFIIGNGPSLKIEDLDRLEDEVTFAANKIYLAFDETKWRPTYYSVEDNLVIKEIYNNVENLKDSKVLLPMKDLKEYESIKDAVYYPLVQNRSSIQAFSDNMLDEVFPGHTVTYSMLQMAVYMGIKELYLIGIDFSYHLPKEMPKKTNTIYHVEETNHFHKDYRKPGDKWIKPNDLAQIRAYESALSFCKKNDIKIYNASRNTKLEVFDRIEFDSLF